MGIFSKWVEDELKSNKSQKMQVLSSCIYKGRDLQQCGDYRPKKVSDVQQFQVTTGKKTKPLVP